MSKKSDKNGKGSCLEGRRLRLRALAPEDAAALFEAVESSREALKRRLRWVTDIGSMEDEKDFISRSAAADSQTKVWGIFDKRTDRLLGVGSLEGISDAERGRARLAFWVRTDRQDRGLGAEVGRLILEHAFRRAGLHRIYARLDPTNRPFRKVLKRLGLRYEGCLRSDRKLNGRWVDQECWGMLRGELKL